MKPNKNKLFQSNQMVKKSLKIYLEDNESQSSVSKSFFDTRLVLWGMVEAIEETERQLENETNQTTFLEEVDPVASDLPVSFGSSRENGKGQKGRKKKRKFSELSPHHRLFHNYRHHVNTNHRIQEENYFYLKPEDNKAKTGEEISCIVQTVGLADIEPIGSHWKIRKLFSFDYSVVYRSQLLPLSSFSRLNLDNNEHDEMNKDNESNLFQYIDEDCWFRLFHGKPEEIHKKYWDQRYRIFSKFDEGIQLDGESWYSITYEQIGEYIVDRCLEMVEEWNESGKRTKGEKTITNVIDGFSGCGGMTIPIAKRGIFVTGIDVDQKKLCYLR
jgi:hypothetical protein